LPEQSLATDCHSKPCELPDRRHAGNAPRPARVRHSHRAPNPWLLSLLLHAVCGALLLLLGPEALRVIERVDVPVAVVRVTKPPERMLPTLDEPTVVLPVEPAVQFLPEALTADPTPEPEDLSEPELPAGNSEPLALTAPDGARFRRKSLLQPGRQEPARQHPMDTPRIPLRAANRPVGPTRAASPVKIETPPYPESERLKGETAVVLVEVELDEQGRVIDASIVSPRATGAFASAALGAARQARYQPALEQGIPVPARIVVRFTFKLE